MMSIARKLTGALLAGAMVLGIGMTAFAAVAPATPDAKPPVTAEQQAKHETLKGLRETIKDLHSKIVDERSDVKGKLETIKELVANLKQDEKRNKEQIVKARAAMTELKALGGDIKAVDEKLQANVADLKAAIEAKDADAAIAAARDILTLMQTKLDLLRTADAAASQVIAHLTAAGQGNAQ